MNPQLTQYLESQDREKEVHQRVFDALNPPTFEEQLLDFRNKKHTGYIINDSSEYQDENSVIRGVITLLAVLAIIYIAWKYSVEISYVLGGGV